jgi:hypothetical protein
MIDGLGAPYSGQSRAVGLFPLISPTDYKARGKLSYYVTAAVTANAPGYLTATSANKLAKILIWLLSGRVTDSLEMQRRAG